MKVGQRVKLVGLKIDTSLNGRIATVLAARTKEEEVKLRRDSRIKVSGSRANQPLLVKEINCVEIYDDDSIDDDTFDQKTEIDPDDIDFDFVVDVTVGWLG